MFGLDAPTAPVRPPAKPCPWGRLGLFAVWRRGRRRTRSALSAPRSPPFAWRSGYADGGIDGELHVRELTSSGVWRRGTPWLLCGVRSSLLNAYFSLRGS